MHHLTGCGVHSEQCWIPILTAPILTADSRGSGEEHRHVISEWTLLFLTILNVLCFETVTDAPRQVSFYSQALELGTQNRRKRKTTEPSPVKRDIPAF